MYKPRMRAVGYVRVSTEEQVREGVSLDAQKDRIKSWVQAMDGELISMLEDPGINHIWRNVLYRCGPLATGNLALLDLVENGVFEDADPGFEDAAAEDYRLRSDAELFSTVGFRPIPMDEIGLYESPWRASWPVETAPVELGE